MMILTLMLCFIDFDVSNSTFKSLEKTFPSFEFRISHIHKSSNLPLTNLTKCDTCSDLFFGLDN